MENFPNLEKVMLVQVQEASRTPNRCENNRISPSHIIIKTISTTNRERILKAVREKKQITLIKVNPSKSKHFSQWKLKKQEGNGVR
jgi:hypothetical protein